MNKLSIEVWFVNILFENLQSEGAKIEILRKTPLKSSKLSSYLAMHITNQKLGFDIFKLGNLQNILMERDLYISVMIYGIKETFIILTHAIYFWQLLQIYRATYDWFCGPGSQM